MIYNLYKKISRKVTLYKLSKNNEIHIQSNLYNVKFDVSGFGNTIEMGKNSGLQNVLIKIKGNNNKLIIGRNVNIKKGILWVEDDNNLISIDNYTTIEDAHIAVTESNHKIIIGIDCMLSHGITIRNGDSHSILSVIDNKRINYAKDIEIGNHVWIGADVAILKGVKINNDSVVGIKSVVTKDVPSNSIVAGNPAKVVKGSISWARVRTYEK